LIGENPQLRTAQDVQKLMEDVVKMVHAAGYFITGCIGIDKAIPCRCGRQMVMHRMDEARGIWGRRCPKCGDAGSQVVTVRPPDPPKPNPLVALLATADTTICLKCGSLAMRRGTCYVCVDCGETSSCS
jgi:hypothetical protein